MLLHAALLLLAAGLAARRVAEHSHWLPPPAVHMVFEGGGKGQSSVPNRAPRAANAPLSPEPGSRAAGAPAVTPPPVPAPPPMPRAAPAPPILAPAAPRTAPGPSRPLVPPPAVVPPRAAPQPFIAPRATAPSLALPPPPAPPPPRARAVPAPPSAAPAPKARKAPFPAPMAFSFGPQHPPARPVAPSRAGPEHSQRGIDLSFAPNGSGADRLSIAGLLDHDGVGTDWTNAFHAWLDRHSYYPSEAGMLSQKGNVVVDFVVAADGTVHDLHLVTSSGHPMLDTATLAMLRDARLPPLNPVDGPRMPVRFTLRYILQR